MANLSVRLVNVVVVMLVEKEMVSVAVMFGQEETVRLVMLVVRVEKGSERVVLVVVMEITDARVSVKAQEM